MRADMFKVIVERPRWGASHAASPKLNRTPHHDTHHIGLKRHARIGAPYSKSLNENLAPLVRFLRSRRAQSWDAVFSELCTGLDTGSTVKMHGEDLGSAHERVHRSFGICGTVSR